MKKTHTVLMALLVVLFSSAWASALKLGDPAPPLDIAEWVKGEPVDLAEGKGKQVYVVEFWATWCAPCRVTSPHLTELQKRYKDQGVTVIGISNEPPETVRPFVESQGEAMGYTVASDNGQATARAYTAPFGVGTIPYAFVVDKAGALVWHGHPMEGLDEVVAMAVAGTYDPSVSQLRAEMEQLVPLWCQEYLILAKFGRDLEGAAQARAKALEFGKLVPDLLDNLAWTLMNSEKFPFEDAAFALALAEVAYADASTGAAVGHTYAQALFENGKQAQAVDVQQKTLDAAKADPAFKDNATAIGQLEDALKRYQAGGA